MYYTGNLNRNARLLQDGRWTLMLRLSFQVLIEKSSHFRISIENILQFYQAMSLVLVDEKFNRNTASPQSSYHLLCLRQRDTWIICSVNHHQGRGDFIHMMNGGNTR